MQMLSQTWLLSRVTRHNLDHLLLSCGSDKSFAVFCLRVCVVTGSCYVVQASLELSILLPQPPEH
jgi:hypothetical protein